MKFFKNPWLLAAVFCAIAWALYGYGETTISWKEDVLLSSGDVLLVERSKTRGPDVWGRAGLGGIRKQSIAFDCSGKRISWIMSDSWADWTMPDILDIVENTPVVVMRVQGWDSCYKQDFPQEGLVAYRFQNGEWARASISSLPKELKVNLLRFVEEAIAYPPVSYKKGHQFDIESKSHAESTYGPPRQRESIAELSRLYSSRENSCAKIRPPPNTKEQGALQQSNYAQRNAATINADLTSVALEAEPVTKVGADERKGRRAGVGYLAPSCRGVVERIEPIQQWSGNSVQASVSRTGYQLILTDAVGSKAQIQDLSHALMDSVVCDRATILTIQRQNKENLIVHRFLHNGQLVDVARVSLPETSKIVDGPEWGILWDATPNDQGLTVSLADYRYPQGQYLSGGLLLRKGIYTVRFPTSVAGASASQTDISK